MRGRGGGEVVGVRGGRARVRGCVGTIVVVVDGVGRLGKFMTEPVSKREGFRHPLLSTQGSDPGDGILRRGEWGPGEPMEPPPSTEAHEVVTPLFVPGWPKAD